MLETTEGESIEVPAEELKAVFFVRSFEGDSGYKERKSYTGRGPGRKIYIRFADNESLIGHTEGDTPWQGGYFLTKPERGKTGFFVRPADSESNNTKVYVFNSAVKDITLIG